jgi:phage baseplate assembly protein W
MPLAYPYAIDGLGRTAVTDDERHVRDLIEQVLFTSPGERVNRPDFGSGLHQLAFAPNSSELAAATKFIVQGALQQWLGDRILIEEVAVDAQDALISIAVRYQIRATEKLVTSTFTRSIG